MTRRVALLGAVLGACSAATSPAPIAQVPISSGARPVSSALPFDPVSPPYPADPKQAARIQRMLRRVSATRLLDPTREVPGVTLDRSELLRRLRAHVDQEVPPQAIADEGTYDALLGLIPPKFDYEKAMYALLEAQLAGYYEPDGGLMLLASDLDETEAEATLAHELVHALQDQHYDLKSRLKYQAGKSDSLNALQCLAEGDATSTMLDVMLTKIAPGKTILDVPDATFVSQVESAMASGPGSDAPRAMRDGLVAPYVDGMRFVNTLRRQGGWAQVNRAWQRMPSTTEQILHVDKWQANEPALDVAAPTSVALGPGFTAADADTLGELSVRVTFSEWTNKADAADAASHWGGDRAVLLRSGDDAAVAWRIRYDEASPQSDAYAERAFAVVSAGMVRTLGPTRASDAGFVCFERPGRAPLALAHSARDLLLAAGPARASDMTPRGECALLKKWSLEALK